jgi:hypothetical protein
MKRDLAVIVAYALIFAKRHGVSLRKVLGRWRDRE